MKRDNDKFLEELNVSKTDFDKLWSEAYSYLKEIVGTPGDEQEVIQKENEIVIIRSSKLQNSSVGHLSLTIIGYRILPTPKYGLQLTETGGITAKWPSASNDTYSLYGANAEWVSKVTNMIREAKQGLL